MASQERHYNRLAGSKDVQASLQVASVVLESADGVEEDLDADKAVAAGEEV